MGGGIHVCGVEGRISGKTMGGGLDLNNLGGTINLLTMGGGITLTNSEIEGKVETMGGRVLIENVHRGCSRLDDGRRRGAPQHGQCARVERPKRSASPDAVAAAVASEFRTIRLRAC